MGKKRTCIFPYKIVPPQRLLYRLTVARRFQPQSTSVDICEGEGECDDSTGCVWASNPDIPLGLFAHPPAPSHLPCQTGSLAALVATVRTADRASAYGDCHPPCRRAALARELLAWTPETVLRGFVRPPPCSPVWPKSGGPVSPAPMESVDRWPLASIAVQIPGGRPSVVAAVRRRDRGWLPSFRGADAAAGPRLSGRWAGSPASGPSLENSVGAIGMVARAPRCVRGVSSRPGALSPLPM